MNKTPVLIAAAAAVAVGLWLGAGHGDAPLPAAPPVAAPSLSPSPPPVATADRPAARAPQASAPTAASAPAPLGSGQVPVFKTTPRGDLVIDRDTRNGLEQLLALNDRAEAQALLREAAASLSPTAARQLLDAANNFGNYQIALTQSFPPGQAPASASEALQQLDALHALRVQQLGPDVAAAYFADEEATSRQLIQAMATQGQLPPDAATATPPVPR